jgi:hypothetical protein
VYRYSLQQSHLKKVNFQKKIFNVWDFVGRKVNQRNPQCQNIAELTNAILEEWS